MKRIRFLKLATALPILWIIGTSCVTSRENNENHTDSTEESKALKSEFICRATDSAVYVFPVDSVVFLNGLLANDKSWKDYIRFYEKQGDFHVYVDKNDEGTEEYFGIQSITRLPFKGDSIYYRINWGSDSDFDKNGATLEAFSLWSDKQIVGGFKVGDERDKLESVLRIKIPDSVRKIIIVNPTSSDYDALRNELNVEVESLDKQTTIYQKWFSLPPGIKIRLRGDSIFNITTTSILPDGSCPSPFYVNDVRLLY